MLSRNGQKRIKSSALTGIQNKEVLMSIVMNKSYFEVLTGGGGDVY